MTVDVVGVIGAGVMGSGVAQNLAATGHRVILIDCANAVLDTARDTIRAGVRLQALFTPGATHDPDAVMARIECSTDLTTVRDAQFVIENVSEDWSIKRPVYERLDAICGHHVVFAANTSAIPIALLASATTRPASVLGIHFMNPVPLKNTVELIRADATSDAAMELATGVLRAMGKDWIVVKDAPGFVSNRVLMLTINEAIAVVHDGVAAAADVDDIFRRCFGHRMGPLATADLIGLDTILHSLRVLREQCRDDKYLPCPLLVQMVDAQRLGCKSGAGFFRYDVPPSSPARVSEPSRPAILNA